MANKLTELGIDISKDLLIKDMGSNFKFYLLNKDAILLSKEYQLKVSSGKIAGTVFIELEKLGISNISVDRLNHSKLDEYKSEVKVKAIKAAKTKAELLSNAINQTIGRAIYIQEQNNYLPQLMNNSNVRIRGISSMSQPEPLDIDFEMIKLEYSIVCRFELN
ncbi:MAG: SIMPL domain-containing protein [Salinivirgaceae bacterium]|jgi:uncharacterized protein YggE|nr:SIMPL domain-containing protein [Salinivirgaceae bacterium]